MEAKENGKRTNEIGEDHILSPERAKRRTDFYNYPVYIFYPSMVNIFYPFRIEFDKELSL